MTTAVVQPEIQANKNGNNNNKVKPKLTLQSILINNKTSPTENDEEEYFGGQMRPRANTDPVSPRPKLNRLRSLHVHFDLPDIIVDDCSDNDEDYMDRSRPEEINKELANTDQGAFFVFQSPPRERSNTCPKNMFSKKRRARNRPPTPPPSDNVPRDFPRHPSWEKVSFSPHSLTKVSEDAKEMREQIADSQESEQKPPKSTSPTRSRKAMNVYPKGTKTTALRSRNTDSPSNSPKRSGTGSTKLQNGHIPRQPVSTREAVHTTG